MRVAHIVPTAYQKHLWAYGFRQSIMAMAPLVLSSSEYLAQMCHVRRECSFLLLDNGTPYVGHAIPDKEIVVAARLLNPDVVVLPDVLHDPVATRSRTSTFLDRYAHSLRTEFMGVIQGETVADYIESYVHLVSDSRVSQIGVPFMSVTSRPSGVVFERKHFFDELRVGGHLDTSRSHHLLGLSDSGHIELNVLSDCPIIACCDTSAAYKMAVAGNALPDLAQEYRKPNIAMDFDAPFDPHTAALLVDNAACLERCARLLERSNAGHRTSRGSRDSESNQ